MPKINQEEYEKIKLLPDYDWNWIAREKTGKILSFTNKPTKTDEVWKDKQTRLWLNYKDSQLFQFIQWEDEEPYEIAELIEEYEHSVEHVSHVINDRMGSLVKTWSESMSASVKKDIKWLRKRLNQTIKFEALNDREIGFKLAVEEVIDLLNQLDEPEVTLDRAFEKVSQSYPMTKEEIWKHLEQIVAHGGKVTYGEPEVLSQEWINEHAKAVTYDGIPDQTEIVYVDDLQNLLVPKKEITEEQVMNWLDNNEFYDHITAETVLERAVDKSELSYYGTKYSVIEAPTIPKYVAEYLEFTKSYASLKQIMEVARRRNELPKWEKEYDWISANDETFARAWLDGYEAEEEPLYHALIKGHELIDSGKAYWIYDKNNDDLFISVLLSSDGNFLSEMSKAEWNKLGINDSNADFVKVDE